MITWIEQHKKLVIAIVVALIVVAGGLDLIFKGLLYKILAWLF